VVRHVEVQHLPTTMIQYDEHEQKLSHTRPGIG
jgi:hypothetical protein